MSDSRTTRLAECCTNLVVVAGTAAAVSAVCSGRRDLECGDRRLAEEWRSMGNMVSDRASNGGLRRQDALPRCRPRFG